MEYLDFELRISPGAGREYPVSVLQSPAGESSGTMTFPFDALALKYQLQALEIAVLHSGGSRRDVVSAEHQSVNDFGKQLFESLLTDKIHETFRRSRDHARNSSKGLRIRLRIDAPELASLPWEYLYDPSERDFVALSIETPLVRYIEFNRPPEPLIIRPPLSILGVVSSPEDRPGLDVTRERQRIETATAGLQGAGLLKLTWLPGSTWRDLQRAMRGGPYHILHYVGHGGFDESSGEGVIALTDDDGKTALLTATQLGRLLADHNSLRMVILNSCLGAKGSGTDVFSSTASILIGRGVPAVVAMQWEISDVAAVEFARSLYEALADGMPVDAAVTEARKAISMARGQTVEWGTPVLHMRSPDGVLFTIHGPTTSSAKASGEYQSQPIPFAKLDRPPRAAAAVTEAQTGGLGGEPKKILWKFVGDLTRRAKVIVVFVFTCFTAVTGWYTASFLPIKHDRQKRLDGVNLLISSLRTDRNTDGRVIKFDSLEGARLTDHLEPHVVRALFHMVRAERRRGTPCTVPAVVGDTNGLRADLARALMAVRQLQQREQRKHSLGDRIADLVLSALASPLVEPYTAPLLDGTDLRGADLRHVNLRSASFTHGCLAGALFDSASVDSAHFTSAVLDGASFRGASMDNTDFRGASMDNTDFFKASLRSSKLTGARGIATKFTRSNLVGADLNEAWLFHGTFLGADLSCGTLGKARLDSSYFSGAIANWAYFGGASLKGVDHWQEIVGLRGAYLKGVTGLAAADLTWSHGRGTASDTVDQVAWTERRVSQLSPPGLCAPRT